MATRALWLAVAAVAVLAQRAPMASAQRPAPGAQRKRPTQKELEQARAHFKAAEAAKSRGEYKTAAVEYLAAYELFADPEFFFDVAEVYRLSGGDQDALTYYEKYLELDPNGRGAASARASADQLRRSIAAGQDAARRAAEEQTRRKAEEEKRAADEEARSKAARLSAAQAAEAERRESSGRNLRIAGIAAGGAGVVSLGLGVFFGLRAKSISDEASNASEYDPARDSDGRAANRNMFLFTGVGGAAVVAGGILYYLGHRARHVDDGGTGVALAPSVGPAQITVTALGRF